MTKLNEKHNKKQQPAVFLNKIITLQSMTVDSLTYTLYARPLNVQSGNNVRVYMRSFHPADDPIYSHGHSFFLDVQQDATVPSIEMLTNDAVTLATEWNERAIPGFFFSVQPYSNDRGVIHAHICDRNKDNRAQLAELSREKGLRKSLFLHDYYSGSKDQQANFPSFSVPLSFGLFPNQGAKGWMSRANTAPSLDQMLRTVCDDVHMYFDIETEGWDAPGAEERVTMLVAGTNKQWQRQVLFTRYDPDIRHMDGYEIIPFSDHADLNTKLLDLVQEYDPLSIAGYNIGAFDLRKLRGWLPEFTIGIDETAPKVMSATGRTTTTQIHGICVLDLYNKMKAELPFLVDQKLGTIMQYFKKGFDDASDFSKAMNYVQLAQAFSDAKNGNTAALHMPIKYTIADGKATGQLHMDQVEESFLDAIVMQRRPEQLYHSIASSADENWRREYMARKHTDPDRFKRGYVARMKPDNEQQRFFGTPYRTVKERDPKTKQIKTKYELPSQDMVLTDAAFVYPTLFLRASKDIFDVWPRLTTMWEYYEKQKTIKRYRGLRKLQEFIVQPLASYFDACQLFGLDPANAFPSATEIPRHTFSSGKSISFGFKDYEFKDVYGNRVVALHDVNRRLSEQTAAWKELFNPQGLSRPFGLINSDTHFLLLRQEIAETIKQSKLGIILARGAALSIGKHAFMFSEEHDTIYIMNTKLTSGSNASWENKTICSVLKETLRGVAQTGIIDTRSVRQSLNDRFAKLPLEDRTTLLIGDNLRKLRKNGTHLLGDGDDQLELEESDDARGRMRRVGLLPGRIVGQNEFLLSSALPDANAYRKRFMQKYDYIFDVILKETRAVQGELF